MSNLVYVNVLITEDNVSVLQALLMAGIDCKQCGKCCKGETIKRVEIEEGSFMELPCKYYDNSCTVYNKRPFACRIYPTIIGKDYIGIHTECDAGHKIIESLKYFEGDDKKSMENMNG